jgi:hypothetical protein
MSQVWNILASWYWSNLSILRDEAIAKGFIFGNEYPRAIIYLKGDKIIYTVFHKKTLTIAGAMDKVHGENMGLSCLIMP